MIYDDCNIIVKYNYVYAWLSDNGDLHEFEKKIYLTNKDEKPAVVRNDNEEVQKDNVIVDNNIKDESSEIEDNLYSAFFDRISQEIDNILKGDFNYEVGTN